uniref:Cytochrome c domain-containing protein n=1 Tax=Candidatus Kentrum eta TaxID=2126337 RepID=A0A450VBQ4_9GAMM|nr:MAG: hypothetical protein BECKH772B_GA0070898_102663 [Candidatus Kentron sp. H]VFK02259.1 MAG: hypothetical protein BECKH772A_GA0070896_102623 [Candidatus Kentron sp. H]VFK05380.1 MAG: hypothetical protein BECKH772C_GA0070978_102653 [Candidatus Kentron sp. H]
MKSIIKKFFPLSILFPALLAVGHAYGADLEAGGKLHEENCVTCHNSLNDGDANSLYTREDRRVTSLPGLKAQVERCQYSLELQWFDKEIDRVTAYLNHHFYHF